MAKAAVNVATHSDMSKLGRSGIVKGKMRNTLTRKFKNSFRRKSNGGNGG